mmetsp:Transcript_37185/g.67315  ORF Transcript_37185/g.67315 Transcript_37185/m.67315 type:complete len:82 (-) Transcript_37185:109-354(-)
MAEPALLLITLRGEVRPGPDVGEVKDEKEPPLWATSPIHVFRWSSSDESIVGNAAIVGYVTTEMGLSSPKASVGKLAAPDF